MPNLFDPFTLKSVRLRNRIGVSPMCQYSAVDGVANEWHHTHLSGLARGGAGLVVVEASAVTPEGRITPGCLGLWNDAQAAALAPAVNATRTYGAVPGIQLAHAGRKASANRPWDGDDHIPASDPRAWEPIAPSPIALGGKLPRLPREMTKKDIADVQGSFVASAIRARELGFSWLNLHFAHGYLAQEFLSPHSNHRKDEYGGSFENRSRFLRDTFRAVREVWPADRALTMRLGVIDFDARDEEAVSEAIALLREFKKDGLDLVDVSMGFSTLDSNPPWGPALLAPTAERVRRETGLPTSTSWFIDEAEQANSLIRDEKVDLVMLARAMLADPHWPYTAARKLGIENPAWSLMPAPYAFWLATYKTDGPSAKERP